MITNIDCPCGKQAALVGGEKIYPHRPDLYAKKFFLCECGSYVGCHATGEPLGFPANAETRAARSAAHAAFDPLWKAQEGFGKPAFESRSAAYKWLAQAMGVPEGEEVHIGQSTAEQAKKISLLCTQKTIEHLGSKS